MAKKKGIFGALSSLFRWTIWGLAGLLAIALYLNYSKDDPATPGGEVVAALPETSTETPAAIEEPEEDEAEEEPPVEEAPETEAEAPVEDVSAEEETAPEPTASDEPAILPETISIPGDDATYAIINAFRHDDGAIEITSTRAFEGVSETTIHLIRCAPLEAGVIAKGDAERNDAPEMERIPLGNAVATLAATACGAMK